MIAFLKREDTRKDEELGQLRQQAKEVRQDGRRERETLTKEHREKMTVLEAQLSEKNEEVCYGTVMPTCLRLCKVCLSTSHPHTDIDT